MAAQKESSHAKMADGFKNVMSNYTNRSSAIFPVCIRENADVRIVFLGSLIRKTVVLPAIMRFRSFD